MVDYWRRKWQPTSVFLPRDVTIVEIWIKKKKIGENAFTQTISFLPNSHEE